MAIVTFWDQVRALNGSTLHSIAQQKAYDVIEVTGDVISLYVHDGGKTRKLLRKDLQPFYEKLTTSGELSARELATVYKFNLSTAISILGALKGVSATTRPMHLYYTMP